MKLLRRSGKPVILIANQGRRPARRGRCRSALEPRSGPACGSWSWRFTVAATGTPSMPARRAARSPRVRRLPARRPAPRGRSSAAPTSAKSSLPQQTRRGGARRCRQDGGHHARPGRQSSSNSGGKTWRFVDCGHPASVHQTAAPTSTPLRTQTALERPRLPWWSSDAANPSPSRTCGSSVRSSGRGGLVLAYKQVGPDRRGTALPPRAGRSSATPMQIPWAPLSTVSARTGRHREVGPGHPIAPWTRGRPEFPPGAPTPFSRRGRLAHPHPVRGEAVAASLSRPVPGRAPIRRLCLGFSSPGIAASSSAPPARGVGFEGTPIRARSGSARAFPPLTSESVLRHPRTHRPARCPGCAAPPEPILEHRFPLG